jgi:hypothetical protein
MGGLIFSGEKVLGIAGGYWHNVCWYCWHRFFEGVFVVTFALQISVVMLA